MHTAALLHDSDTILCPKRYRLELSPNQTQVGEEPGESVY
jgi:hypothetical protein